MPSISHLLGKLGWRPRLPSSDSMSAKTGRDREPPLVFGEILAASAYLDFGGLPLEFWPGYRNTGKTTDDRQ